MVHLPVPRVAAGPGLRGAPREVVLVGRAAAGAAAAAAAAGDQVEELPVHVPWLRHPVLPEPLAPAHLVTLAARVSPRGLVVVVDILLLLDRICVCVRVCGCFRMPPCDESPRVAAHWLVLGFPRPQWRD